MYGYTPQRMGINRPVTAGGGAFTLAQAVVDGAPNFPGPATASITVTAGNNLIIGVRWDTPAVSISSITITGESNATVRGSKSTGGGSAPDGACQWATLLPISTSGAKTVTANMSGSTGVEICVMEITGTMTFDSAAPAATSGTSTNPTTTITTAADDDFIASLLLNTATAVSTGGVGYTRVLLNDVAYNDVLEYKLAAGVAGSKTVDWVNAESAAWMMAVICCKH